MFRSVHDQHRNSNIHQRRIDRVIPNVRYGLMISRVFVLFSAPELMELRFTRTLERYPSAKRHILMQCELTYHIFWTFTSRVELTTSKTSGSLQHPNNVDITQDCSASWTNFSCFRSSSRSHLVCLHEIFKHVAIDELNRAQNMKVHINLIVNSIGHRP